MPADRAGLAARGEDGAPAITGPAGTVDYRTLRAEVAAYAAACRPGERVAVADPDPVRVAVAVLGACAAGATAVVVDPAWPAGQRAAALRAAGAGEVHPGDGRCWIGFTSGSAGTPRPIGRTAHSWAVSFPLVSERTGIAPGRRVLVGGSLASSLFLFGTLHALWAGAHVVAPGRWDPDRPPDAEMAHCVPTMLADLVAGAHPPRLAVCGGAALPDRVRRAARAAGTSIMEYYGATELSFVAWRDDRGRLMPFPDVELRLRDGEIWARSPYLSTGYAAPVTGPLRWDADGYATVGDLGVITGDGGLVLLGRGDGTILTGGAPVLPQDVETVLAAVPGVRDVVVVGTPHPRIGAVVTAVVEPADPDAPPRLSELRAAARARLSAAQRPRRWYLMRLPRTGAGKVARAAVARAVEAGDPAAGPPR